MGRKEEYKECFEYGGKYEKEFFVLLTKRGIKKDREPIIAKVDDDMKRHIDMYAFEGGPSFDVKGPKYVGKVIDDNYFVVEFKNVNGDDGWLFGDADFIAVATRTEWIIVNRLKLIELVNTKVASFFVKNFNDCLYCHHTRHGNQDDITMIKTIDLRDISDSIIKRIETSDNWVIGDSVIHSERFEQVNQRDLQTLGYK